MMSDHWKLLANILGTPGPADPVAKETTKKKPEAVPAEERPADAPKCDPLAEIVVRNPDPIVPGFVVPEPETAKNKPTPKRSAWDSLIGSLGIKPAAETIDEIDETAVPTQTTAAVEPNIPPRPSVADRISPRTGFGSGLIDDSEDVAWPSSAPQHHSPSTSFSKHVGPSEPEQRRRDAESTRREEPSRREEPVRRNESSRRNEPARGEERRPARQSGRSDSTSRPSRSAAPQRDDRSKSQGFADGLIDWDHEPDDEFVTDDPIVDELDIEPVASAGDETFDRPREEEDRPRGRGRRGGSRNRGHRDDRTEPVASVDAASLDDEDSIGWHKEVDDDLDEPIADEPIRHSSPRAERPSRDAERDSRRPRHEDRPSDEPAAGGQRRGRRGQRQMMSGSPTEDREPVSRSHRDDSASVPAFDFIEEDDDLLSEELGSPASGDQDTAASDSPGRPRRRRGRRGRGSSASSTSGAERARSDDATSDRTAPQRSASSRPDRQNSNRQNSDRARPDRDMADRKGPVDRDAIDEVPFAAELDIDAVDAVELDDDQEDHEEAERISRGRRRGGRGRGDSRRRGEGVADSDTAGSVPVAESGDDASVLKHRNVPTWLDAVNLLVESNIERHRRSGPPRAPQGRGGRR